jgi:hypothetical protein
MYRPSDSAKAKSMQLMLKSGFTMTYVPASPLGVNSHTKNCRIKCNASRPAEEAFHAALRVVLSLVLAMLGSIPPLLFVLACLPVGSNASRLYSMCCLSGSRESTLCTAMTTTYLMLGLVFASIESSKQSKKKEKLHAVNYVVERTRVAGQIKTKMALMYVPSSAGQAMYFYPSSPQPYSPPSIPLC